MDALEAALTVLREEGAPLHWTRIQDLALRRGYLDPFETPRLRQAVLSALARGVRDGTIERTTTGVYRAPG
jgi:hypothetical protein